MVEKTLQCEMYDVAVCSSRCDTFTDCCKLWKDAEFGRRPDTLLHIALHGILVQSKSSSDTYIFYIHVIILYSSFYCAVRSF